MAKKISTPLTKHKFATTLYVSLCIDAMLKMQTDDESANKKIVELLLPLLEELFEDMEILS